MENIWEKMQFARDDRKFPYVNVKVCPSVKVNFKHTQYHILNEKKIKMGGWRWGGPCFSLLTPSVCGQILF